MLLEKSERFTKEYRDFSDRISKIDNEKVKKELVELLNRLLAEVRSIDRQHEDIIAGIKLPSRVNDHRDSVVDIRKKIIKRLEDWDKRSV
jgi:predicted nuclease with TOPRIM domain